MTPGDVYMIDFPAVGGHEQHGVRPAVVLQDDGYAGALRTTLVVPLSSQPGTVQFPGVVSVPMSPTNGLRVNSFALVFQMRVVDRPRLQRRMGQIDPSILTAIHVALDRLLGRVQSTPSSPTPP